MDSRQELHHVFELVQAQFVPIHPGDRAKPGAREVGSCKKGFGRYASWVMPQLSQADDILIYHDISTD